MLVVSQPPFKNTTVWSLGGDWWSLREVSQAIKKGRKLLVSLPCLLLLWITSYICLSILANGRVPSICHSRQSRLLICLMVIWKDIVFDLSVFIYKTFLFKSQQAYLDSNQG